MDIIDYDIIKSGNKILIFLKVEENPEPLGKLSYKTLGNIIYEISGGYCVTDRKGVPLTIRDDLELCTEFIREELSREHTVRKELVLDIGDED